MNTKYRGLIIAGIIVAFFGIIFLYYKGMYNKEVRLNQNVKEEWANVETNYQRRADLIGNLVNTVKGYAEHEESVLVEVQEARSKATAINIDATNLTPERFAEFQKAQDGLSSALNRLMMVTENYPNLKADRVFIDLMASIEGTENRINKARKDYNAAVKAYNAYALKMMVNMLFHPEEKPYFKATQGAEVAPTVDFTKE